MRALAALLCVSLVLPPQFGVALALAHSRSMMRRWLLTGVLTMWAVLVSAQSGDVSAIDDPMDATPTELSIALPNQWLILQPGEIVTFIAKPRSGREDHQDEWYALAGEILNASDGRIVYQAPSKEDETFDLLVWHNPSTELYVAIPITLKCETDEITLLPEKIEGENKPVYRVPTASNSEVIVFAVQRSDGDGFSICLPGRPLNPRPGRCLGGGNFTVVREKLFLRCGNWWVACRIFVDARLAAEIRRRFGVSVRANVWYDINIVSVSEQS